MSNFGLKVWDKYGNKDLDTNDRVSRLLWRSDIVGDDGSQELPEIAGLRTCEFGVAVNRGLVELAPTVYRSGNTIYWDYYNYLNFYSKAESVIYVFAYT